MKHENVHVVVVFVLIVLLIYIHNPYPMRPVFFYSLTNRHNAVDSTRETGIFVISSPYHYYYHRHHRYYHRKRILEWSN